ncbi:MAG: hypothetical protein WDK95_15385 [Syntrophorhabdaceae bacterium]
MAITYTEPDGSTTVTYEGRVLATYCDECRVMSDVYVMASYATVIEADGTYKNVLYNYNFELDTRNGVAIVDAPEDVIQAWNTHKQVLLTHRRRQEYDAALLRVQEEETRRKNRPEKGKVMRVARGRKVKIGTVGEVFFVRDGRVGLNVTGKKDAKGWAVDPVWVNADYLVAV